MTERFHYDRSAARGDLIRGGFGLAITVLPIALVPMHWVLLVLFGGAGALFAVFTWRTWQRMQTVVEADDTGVSLRGPGGGSIRWSELETLKLAYFSTRRDRQKGWMQLTLRGSGRTFRFESTLDRFEELADRAAEAAHARGLELEPATENNLTALGVLRGPTALDQEWGLDRDRLRSRDRDTDTDTEGSST